MTTQTQNTGISYQEMSSEQKDYLQYLEKSSMLKQSCYTDDDYYSFVLHPRGLYAHKHVNENGTEVSYYSTSEEAFIFNESICLGNNCVIEDSSVEISDRVVIDSNVMLFRNIKISEGTKIGRFTKIMTNCRIGKDCVIGSKVVVRGAKINDKCIIASRVLIKEDLSTGAEEKYNPFVKFSRFFAY